MNNNVILNGNSGLQNNKKFSNTAEREVYKNKKVILDEEIFLKINDILGVEYQIEKYKSYNIPEENLDELMLIASDGFGIKMLYEDVKNHIFKSEDTYLLKINGTIVGFSSTSSLGDFIYRFGTVIRKEFQAKGLYKKLSKTIMDNEKKYFLRTQNQNVIKSLEKSFDNVIYGKEALKFMGDSMDSIDIDNFMLKHGDSDISLNDDGVFKGVYGGKMGEESRVDYIDNEYYKGFSPEEGDSLLVVYFNNK